MCNAEGINMKSIKSIADIKGLALSAVERVSGNILMLTMSGGENLLVTAVSKDIEASSAMFDGEHWRDMHIFKSELSQFLGKTVEDASLIESEKACSTFLQINFGSSGLSALQVMADVSDGNKFNYQAIDVRSRSHGDDGEICWSKLFADLDE